MRKGLTAASALLFIATLACTQTAKAQVKYSITGSWQGGDGQKIVLNDVAGDDKAVGIDSTTVKQGGFKLEGTIGEMKRIELRCKAGNRKIFVYGEPVRVDITERTDTAGGKERIRRELKITAGAEQQVLEKGEDLSFMASLMQLGQMFALSKALEEQDSVVRQHNVDSIQNMFKLLNTELEKKTKNYLDSARDCFASTYFIEEYIAKNKSFDEFKQCYENLTDRVKASPRGKALKAAVDALASATVGGIAPDIQLKTPEGELLSLGNLRGHIVLLDFWASWCGPCLKEMPNVKAIYSKYHEKGLEIYGVSLDDKADAWRNAIAKHGLCWHHVSSLKGWECPVAKMYNVTGIPRMYIIDESGRIIAQDLRGEALSAKMDELFKSK